MTADSQMNGQSIVIYQTEDGRISVDVKLSGETVWLSLNQIAELFERDKSVISKHLKNVFKERELDEDAVVAKFATTASDGKTYQVAYYNLDAILSVGYRVNSKRGTQFRRWASQTLKEHLIQGYTLNQKRLNKSSVHRLQQSITLLSKTLVHQSLVNEMGSQVIEIIKEYARTWDILFRYDENQLGIDTKSKSSRFSTLSYEEVAAAIHSLKMELGKRKEASHLFGYECNDALRSILGNLEQTFDGVPVYNSCEETAAHLTVFCDKRSSF